MMSRCLITIFGLAIFFHASVFNSSAASFPEPYKGTEKLEIPVFPIQVPKPWGTQKYEIPTNPLDTPFRSQIPQIDLPQQNDWLRMLIESPSTSEAKPSRPAGVNISNGILNTTLAELLLKSPELKDVYIESLREQIQLSKAEAKYRIKALAKMSEDFDSQLSVRGGAFRLQQTFGWVSLVAVHLLLAAGLFISIKEALAASKLRDIGTSEGELKLSMAGIAVKTSLQSVLILAITLAFYFLYLKFVFPITEL